jgi:hypothetical protein
MEYSSPVVNTNAREQLISKRPFAVTKCSPWLVSKQSYHLSGSKLSYTEICYNNLPHLLPSSPYRPHTIITRVTKPCSQYYGKTKRTCRNPGHGHSSVVGGATGSQGAVTNPWILQVFRLVHHTLGHLGVDKRLEKIRYMFQV